ncbi:MAG: membrane protein insertion efficiency factor YidD [Patescibacteria group bacterium]|nr:membrane protein insertion efficiency factor YidD [Patescibacteria group bacterium]
MRALIIKLIKAYQILISPCLGQHCRFYPSCSQYAVLAIKKQGVVRGLARAMWRILRCNPLSGGGVDEI